MGELVADAIVLVLVVIAVARLVRTVARAFRFDTAPAKPSTTRPRAKPNPIRDAMSALSDAEEERDKWRERATKAEANAARLRDEITTLRTAYTAMERDRDQWQARAGQGAAPSGASSRTGDDKQFSKLRAVILKAIHPDHGGSTPMEKAVLGEVFKKVWPEIERIERGV